MSRSSLYVWVNLCITVLAVPAVEAEEASAPCVSAEYGSADLGADTGVYPWISHDIGYAEVYVYVDEADLYAGAWIESRQCTTGKLAIQ